MKSLKFHIEALSISELAVSETCEGTFCTLIEKREREDIHFPYPGRAWPPSRELTLDDEDDEYKTKTISPDSL